MTSTDNILRNLDYKAFPHNEVTIEDLVTKVNSLRPEIVSTQRTITDLCYDLPEHLTKETILAFDENKEQLAIMRTITHTTQLKKWQESLKGYLVCPQCGQKQYHEELYK